MIYLAGVEVFEHDKLVTLPKKVLARPELLLSHVLQSNTLPVSSPSYFTSTCVKQPAILDNTWKLAELDLLS
jgi:hypothetical protein